MIILYILLITAGALPLIVFLTRRRSYYHVLRHGVKTKAQIIERKSVRYRGSATHDRVVFSYLPAGSGQYLQGDFIAKLGQHRHGDLIDIYYLPQQPQKNAVPGSKGELGMFIFVLLIFVFVVFACYQIHQEVKDDGPYTFKAPWKD